MNNEAMKEILNELFSHLERLETQSEAILQFLKEKKRVTDKQLAPYLEQAGNASNVKWRAARIRIEHLLSPEHPEKEVKLGKQPELHEETARAGSSEDERSKAAGEEAKQSEEKRTKAVENPVPADAVQIRPGDGKADKPEKKLESERQNKEQAAQTKQAQDSESAHHPTEVTEPLARKEGAEPAAQLKSEEKKDDQEAA
jgi:hypothetical protein